MLSKVSSAFKMRLGASSQVAEEEAGGSHSGDVLASVLEQHPNMSMFHQSSEVPFPTPSPPASPSKHGRRGMFKRMSKQVAPNNDSTEALPRLNTLTKKVKSSLSSPTAESLSRATADIFVRQSQDTARPSIDSTSSRPSLPPTTPVMENKVGFEGKFGSLRSILKVGNTPGTGQSVRFFSRDAYRVISPEQSSAEMEEHSLINRIQKPIPSRPTAQQLFATPPPPPPPKDEPPSPQIIPSTSTPMMGGLSIPPPSLGNIFEFSEGVLDDVPSIPAIASRSPMLDDAVEVTETETETETEKEEVPTVKPADDSLPIPTSLGAPFGEILAESSPKPPPGLHDRSQSFSFGQTVFQSVKSALEDAAKGSPARPPSVNRSRAVSDTVFTSMIHSPTSALKDRARPEADINDTSQAVVAYASQGEQSPLPKKPVEHDPFAANAMTYYEPGKMLPPSPPQSNHTRTASREEDLIWSLRTQLALQSELCGQYEVDLAARDALVETLNQRLAETERECERRKSVVRSWRKRVSELEKYVKGLEESVERSREESMERSVMDEASGEALRMLHRRMGELEREKGECERREIEARMALESREKELLRAAEELRTRDLRERELQEGITAAKEQMEMMGVEPPAEGNVIEERKRHSVVESVWEQERVRLATANDVLRDEKVLLQTQITNLREEVVRKEEDLQLLRGELEAQWRHTEQSGEELERVHQEKGALTQELEELRAQFATLESEREEIETKNVELDNEVQDVWTAKDELEKVKVELEDQLRKELEHSDELTAALQEREDRVSTLDNERKYAFESVARLQDNLRQRDAEITELNRRFRERDLEVDDVRDGLTRQKREHARIVDEQSRKLSEVVAREVESRHNMERAIKEKVETDVIMHTLNERVGTMSEELEKLRRQVHELQQESADKEVKLTQAAKQRAQDKEDIQGLNIALDSKQQEVELLKRRMGSRTSVSTASSVSKTPFRRESSIFGTPNVSRPPSALSDAGSTTGKERKLSDPPAAIKPLTRSVRPNGTLNSRRMTDGAMGPPSAVKRTTLSTVTTANATPSRISSLPRPPSVTPTAKSVKPGVARHRVSSSLESLRGKGNGGRDSVLSSSDVSEQSEKENISVTPSATRRLSVALPA